MPGNAGYWARIATNSMPSVQQIDFNSTTRVYRLVLSADHGLMSPQEPGRPEPGRELVAQLDELSVATGTPVGDGACTDAVAEWLEQGEYLDPDTLDWPDH